MRSGVLESPLHNHCHSVPMIYHYHHQHQHHSNSYHYLSCLKQAIYLTTKVQCLRFGTQWSSQAEHRLFKIVHNLLVSCSYIWINIHSYSFVHILSIFCSYFQILYCVDSSDPMMIGAATISLIQLLHHPALQV